MSKECQTLNTKSSIKQRAVVEGLGARVAPKGVIFVLTSACASLSSGGRLPRRPLPRLPAPPWPLGHCPGGSGLMGSLGTLPLPGELSVPPWPPPRSPGGGGPLGPPCCWLEAPQRTGARTAGERGPPCGASLAA